VLGPNGSGKTTMLKSIMNLVSVNKGKIMFLGQDITGKPIHELTKVGLAFVPEERHLFPAMTVMENLQLGAYTIRDKKTIKGTFNRVFELFPRLAERKKQYAGTMSGGERQMLAIARGIMSNPKMLILDEPSMGLAPQNVTVLIVEQNVNTTLTVADRAYVMEQGRIVMEGSSSQLQGDDHIRKMYMGIA